MTEETRDEESDGGDDRAAGEGPDPEADAEGPAEPPERDAHDFEAPTIETPDDGDDPPDEEPPLDAESPPATESEAVGGRLAGPGAVESELPPEANLPEDGPVDDLDAEKLEPTEATPERSHPAPDGTEPAIEPEPPEPPERDERVEEIVAEAREKFDDLDTALATPSAEVLRERYFDFSYLDRYDPVERTWVTPPNAYVTTLYDPSNDAYRYHVSEPTLDEFEAYVRRDLEGELRDQLMYEDVDPETDRETVVERRADALLSEYSERVDDATLQKVRYYLLREFVGVGKIDPIMGDPDVEDVSCVGSDLPVYVYHSRYRDLPTNISFAADRLNAFVSRLAARAGKHVSVSNPLIDATMPDGSRVQLTLGRDVAARGSNFTVRKFAEVPRTPIQLIKWGTFSLDAMAYLWLAIQNDASMLFAGGTASGKTTTMNACGFFIPPNSKVVSIEDTREITLPHDNWIQSISRGSFGPEDRGAIGTHDLLQAGLRQRPEFLLVGEMRTEAEVALTFFQAIATGHSGYSTVHADSAVSVFDRLRNPPLSIPDQLLRSLDVIAVQKQQFVGDQRVRRNTSLVEVVRTRQGDVGTNEVFSWDPGTDTFDRNPRSYVFDEIQEARGWSDRRLRREYDARRVVLEYLTRNDIVGYEPVARTFHGFARRPDAVIDAIRDGELKPDDPDEPLLPDVDLEPDEQL